MHNCLAVLLSHRPAARRKQPARNTTRLNRSLSLYLDLIRPLAAFAVLLSHISLPAISGELKWLRNAGPQAVDVFFVLSGFVIAYVCATREHTLKDYTVARAARIYSVAIPTLFLTFLLDTVGQSLNPRVYTDGYQAFSPGLIIRSLLFVGEQWNAHRYPGSNSPYWSLGFEVWYYIAFGAFMFCRWRWIAAASVLLFIGPKVAIMFPLWLMGVGSYHICKRDKVPNSVGWVLFIAPVILMGFYEVMVDTHIRAYLPVTAERFPSIMQDYFIATLFAAHLIGFSAISTFFASVLAQYAHPIRWIAGTTFSIYLTHLPIMHFWVAVFPTALPTPILILITLASCVAFAHVSESRKDAWRKVIMSVMQYAGAIARRITSIRTNI